MPSSITLTVSHLPTSTSFFLSALQPLDYAYRGRSGQTIGFGPANSNAPPDFWITQEIPGVPAGAAHVAFPAASQTAVQDFFMAALKAGGKIHGEPCVRDASGYYSAAIIDFDGNSIEAVYRPGFGGDSDKENDVRSMVSTKRSSPKPATAVSRAPTSSSKSPTKAPSQAPTSTPRTTSPPKGDLLDSILNEARSTANVARDLVNQVRPQLNSSNSAPPAQQTDPNKSGDNAIVGTLLGVAAGAALHYAFTNNRKSEKSPPRTPDDRPSLSEHGRSYTEPQHHYDQYPPSSYHHHHHQYAIDAGTNNATQLSSRGRYITMHDNDRDSTYSSTVRPTSSRASRSRRGSVDSGIGISPPSSGGRKGVKMLEAPPSAYRGPTSAVPSMAAPPASNASRRSRRSSSASRAPPPSGMGGRQRRSSSAGRDARTVVHVKESLVRMSTAPDSRGASRSSKHGQSGGRRDDGPPPPNPGPPMRAATWGTPSMSNGGKSARGSRRGSPTATIVGLDKMSSEASQKTRDMTKSVVGKVKAQRGLDLPRSEVGPEDSVSQVSSVRPSSGGRSRRR